MKVFAIGTVKKGLTPEEIAPYMTAEPAATLQLYLDGKIEQFWFRDERAGAIFLMNVDSVDEAKAITSKLPITQANLHTFEFMPVGPLAPLGRLIQN